MNNKTLSGTTRSIIDISLLLLRLIAGLSLAILHGLPKLQSAGGFLFAGHAWGFVGFIRSLGFPAPALFAVCAALSESIGALLVAGGILTRLSAGSVAFTMLVAIYSSFKLGSSPSEAAFYFVLFVVIVVTGPGKFSVDHFLRGRRTARPLGAAVVDPS